MEQNQRRKTIFQLILVLLYIFATGLIIILLVKGWRFYFASSSERFYMTEFRSWRSAGFIGHGLGMLGSGMMILMLLYSVRKRTRLFREIGHLNYWLKIHIFFGIMGPMFIILHSSFRMHGLVVISFWSMIAVALSGVVGRYLYLQIPRNIFGEELDLQQAKELHHDSHNQLFQFGLSPHQLTEIRKIINPVIQKNWGGLRILLAIFIQDIYRPLRVKKLYTFIDQQITLEKTKRKELLSMIQQQSLLQRRIMLWNSFHSLFNYWHVIHRPFAYIMYLIMLVHVGVAVWLGYSWLF